MAVSESPSPETAARTPAAVSDPGHPGWFPVASVEDVGTTPREVVAGGRRFVAFRPEPGAPAAVVAARCPHRLVRLDRARPVGGRLECAYHGWQFDAAGRCVAIPSAGPDATVPERAHLDVPWGVRERDGLLWVAPVDPDVGADVDPDVAPDFDGEPLLEGPPADELLTSLHPALERGWHPPTLADELPPEGSPLAARLLGRAWTVRRGAVPPDGGHPTSSVRVDPAPYAVAERFGLIWIAPDEPVTALLDCPDDDDPAVVGAWLPPERSTSAAGVPAENFLDVAHFRAGVALRRLWHRLITPPPRRDHANPG